jgi:hypothetical protein
MAVCPFANQSKRYDRKYPGGYAPGFTWRGILHSTETTGLPSYKSGSVAPHFTVDPKTGRIWQHYDTSRPSRALLHAGSVQTNNARAIQIEIIAYSDAGIAKRVGGLRVDQLTAAQLAPVSKLMRWIEAAHQVKRSSGLVWESYPASAGVVNGVRMSAGKWQTFAGWAGHSHVPTNDHGDPSDIAIDALLGQLLPSKPPATKEDRDVMYEIGVTGRAATFLSVNNSDLIWIQDSDHKARINLMYKFLFGEDIHEITTTSPDPVESGLYGFLKGPSPSEVLPGETEPREPGWTFTHRTAAA